jgi:hypothetical protein
MTMQTTSPHDLINVYLADETKLYQDWYASIQPRPADPDTTPFGMNESLEELKQRFVKWWQDSIEKDSQRLQLLKETLCQKWLALKDHESAPILIAIVSDALTTSDLPHSLPVATILVTSGIFLTQLCAECDP